MAETAGGLGEHKVRPYDGCNMASGECGFLGMNEMQRTYTVILSHDPETGYWLASMPMFRFGAFATFGFSREHALDMAQEWIELNILGLLEDGEPVPEDTLAEVATVTVTVPPPA